MKTIASLALAAAASALALPAAAQFAKPEDAVKYRQSALTVMGTHFSRIGAMANGRVPFDPKAALENAQVVHDVARLPWAGFGPGTDKISAKAKPEIWTEQAKFKDHADKLVAESAKLLAAAKTQNLDTLKASFGATAGTCKACHDAFRGN
jgi:cytochrome c556